MELKSRQAYILKLILKNPEGCSVEEITTKLNITRRTFYYDFEQINDWMKSGGIGKAVIESHVVNIQSEKMKELKCEIKKNESYFYSIEERRILELLYILLSPEVVTIERMQRLFDVSKNTVLMDIKEWKTVLKKQEIAIVSTIKAGYVLQGEEFAIRKLTGQQIKKLENFQPKDLLKKWIQEALFSVTGEEYDYRELARCLIKQYEQDENIKLVSENEEFEYSMILISWIRSMESHTMVLSAEEKAALASTRPYQSLRKSFQKLKEHHMDIPDSELYYMATLLLGIKMAQFTSQNQEDLYIYRFTASLIKNFERIACITFENRERLASRLIGHIRPLYYRLKYGMQSVNPLVKDVMRMYPEVYAFTERAIKAMPDNLAQTLTEDEIAYITVYFISDDRSLAVSEERDNTAKILVLCAAGVATSTLIKEQLKKLLGDIADIELGIVPQAKNYRLESYSLILSTSYSEELSRHENVIFTDVVLKDKDKQKIISILNQYGIVGKYDRLVQKIVAAAESSTLGQVKKNELYFNILRILYEEGHKRANRNVVPFQSYMEEKRYETLPPGSGVLELLTAGCKGTVRKNEWKRLYDRLCNMIRRYKLKYYEIAEDVVLIHCPMQGDSGSEIRYFTAVSESRLDITNYISGKVFIFFATVDQNTHFPVLKELYDYCDSGDGKKLLEDMKGKKP